MLNLIQLNRNIRSIRRYRQIVKILIKYGFDHLLEYFNLSQFVARSRRVLRRNESTIAQLSPAERMRLALEELGPSFIKLGQVLSTRPDIVPEAYTIELAALRDDVRPFPFRQVETILTEEYHRPLNEVFRSLEPVPVASASISQVHRAVLPDGRTVALKDTPGGLVLTPALNGLAPGTHGFHVHEKPDCGPGTKDGKTMAGLAAGGHFDPGASGKHEGHMGKGHLGDLPALVAGADGAVTTPVTAPRLKASSTHTASACA